MKKLEVESCEDFSKVLHRILTDLDLKLVFLTHAHAISKRKSQKCPSDLEKLAHI